MGSGVGGRFYHTLMLLYDGENLCFFACDVYVLKLICFKNSMYCDILRYVTFTNRPNRPKPYETSQTI
jgi:hypothetical protein